MYRDDYAIYRLGKRGGLDAIKPRYYNVLIHRRARRYEMPPIVSYLTYHFPICTGSEISLLNPASPKSTQPKF